jgi:hypothetical protein
VRNQKVGRKRTATVLGVFLALAVAGGAFAYWTIGGSGTGSASAGTVSGVTVVQTSSVSGLYPGGPAQALSGTFNNPNAGKVYVSSVTAAVHAFSSTAVDATKPACTQADFVIGGSAPVAAEINPGNAQGSWSGLTVALSDAATNQDNCKGAAITIDYTANP